MEATDVASTTMSVSTVQITTMSSNLCVACFEHNSKAVECNEYLLLRACMVRKETDTSSGFGMEKNLL